MVTRWEWLLRGGADALRRNNPGLFYPVYVNVSTHSIHSVGEPIALDVDRNSIVPPNGCTVVWPIKTNGVEGRWRCSPTYLRELISKGCARVGEYDKVNDRYSLLYLNKATLKRIENNEIDILGNDSQGALILGKAPEKQQLFSVKTVWNRNLHRAGEFGTRYIRALLPGRNFPYPKSLYAVKDSLHVIVANKPNALIVDFFAGSGTTMHAVNLLNAEDGGHRRCIMVTNNEVSADEAKMLKDKGYQPGDTEWEKLGIAHYVTWPRTVCSIKGQDVNGAPLKGDYLGSEPPMHMADGFKANAAFFKLGFLDPTAVSLGMRISEMLPTLWLKTGAKGKCPELTGEQVPDMLILPENQFAVLINENTFADFAEKLAEHPEIQTVFLATDYEVNYQSMVKNLNVTEAYQLYRDYLDHFRVNRGRN